MPPAALKIDGLTLRRSGVELETTKYDLAMALRRTDEGLMGVLGYKTDLFEAPTIERLAGHYQPLLEGIVADPETRIEELPLLTESERHQILIEWNDTTAPYSEKSCIHQLIETQAERTPDAIALVFGNEELSYRELNRRANKLAHYLRARGVRPEVRVGICLERSIELVIAVLGISKAGGAYVPLDPSYPTERLDFMLEDAQPALVLTQERFRARLPDSVQVVRLDVDWKNIMQERDDNPSVNMTPDHLAYLIYTSGSTGRPKGVLVTHRGVVNLAAFQARMFGITATDRALQASSFNWDAWVYELMMSLPRGATLCICPPDILPGPMLNQFIREHSISVIGSTPGVTALLNPQELPLVRTVMVGGDVCSSEEVSRWIPGREFFNNYGPTEASVICTSINCQLDTRPPPIGRPIGNTQIYLLDQHMQPVPIGVAGELYIGGIGLARGYLNDSVRTAERFIPNPFSREPGARLYKSGDLARYRADGNIEFIGRLDQQVKLRGLRIELEEIETILKQHLDVRDAVAVVREDARGEKQLIAYFVSNADAHATSAELRAFLKSKLPGYMIPAAFVRLAALPLSPIGKVDRKALPPPEQIVSDEKRVLVAPRDSVELKLVRIWEHVLKVAPVSVNDNFFDLGGHSLLGAQLLAQIQQEFGFALPLVTLFQEGTVGSMASLLRQMNLERQLSPTQSWSPLVGIQPHGHRLPFFCVHPVGGNVVAYTWLARELGSDQPFYGLQARGLEDDQAPLARVEEMASFYLDALRSVQPHGPYCLGGWSFGGVVAFEMAQQLQRLGEPIALLALIDTIAPQQTDSLREVDEVALTAAFVKTLQRSASNDLPELVQTELRQVDPKTRLQFLTNVMPNATDLPSDVALRQAEHYWRVYQANLRALENYVPQVYGGPLLLLRAQEHSGEDLPMYIWEDPTFGWSNLTTYPVTVHGIPGNHDTILQEPNVLILAAHLKNAMVGLLQTQSADSKVVE
jgi:amino acid adenylation domain-containing protein